jgi:hypothetical protein
MPAPLAGNAQFYFATEAIEWLLVDTVQLRVDCAFSPAEAGHYRRLRI